MKNRLIPALVAAALLVLPGLTRAAEEPTDAAAELKALVGKIQTKLQAGDRTEEKLTEELKEFDALLANHKEEKTDDVAQILFMKAQLYLQVFRNQEKGDALLAQLKQDFPDSRPVTMLKQQEEAERIRSSLVEGASFPAFDEKDLEGKPFNLETYKGKVVLIDFWATWCGPCVAELPNVLEAYEKHHAAGFEILGISLDSDEAKLKTFIKEKNMPWPQYFDGKGWQNKLAGQYGVNSIPATYLLDGEGRIVGKNLRGTALEAAVAKALAKE